MLLIQWIHIEYLYHSEYFVNSEVTKMKEIQSLLISHRWIETDKKIETVGTAGPSEQR